MAEMKLNITALKDGENVFSYRSDKHAWLKTLADKWTSGGSPVKSVVELTLSLTNLEPDYYLKGQLSCDVERPCARCADEFSMPIKHAFSLALVHRTKRDSDKESEAQQEADLDIEFFSGDEINVEHIIEEQFQLSLPYVSVCGDEENGVFPCGKKRSELGYLSPDDTPQGPSPFDTLKGWKPDGEGKS